jgi:hypothetical protein
LSEVQHCTLEPGGAFYFESKEPRPHDRQHADVMKRLNELGGQIDDLRRLVSPR